MRSHRLLFPLFSLTLLAAALPSCGLFTPAAKGPLTPAANPPIADVPIPAGFERTSDSTSKVVPDTGLRIVDHRYKGSSDVLPVAKFYKDQLPEKGWKWIDQTESKGDQVTLHFAKSKEECFITITKDGFPTYHTYIQVKIDPTGSQRP